MELTKKSEAFLCIIYKEFIERQKSGMPCSEARNFEDGFHHNVDKLSEWNRCDMNECIAELKNCGYIKCNIIGDIKLTDKAIIDMENRFKNNIKSIASTIKELLSLIPF